MKKYFPILDWIASYGKHQLGGDLPAGLTVGIMLIPQGMAYALIAGLPAVYGLYASLAPQVIYAIMGTSRQLAVGPVAMDSLLVATGLSVIAAAESEHYIMLAIVLAFMMGVMQLAMGIFRLGFLVNFLSKPVISGFTSAAALIIGFNQLKHLVGVDIGRNNKLHLLLMETFSRIGETHWITLVIGLVGIIIIKLLKRYAPKVPAALVVVVIGILIVKIFNMVELGVKVVGDIPEGLPSLIVPSLELDSMRTLFPIALTLALIAFMEAISVAKAIEQNHNDYKVSPNQELIAIGSANIVGSFFQSYPTTGGFSRTAVSDQAGAKTGMYSIISALVVALTLLFFTPLFHNLPNSILASIIMVAVFGLIDFAYPKRLWNKRKDEFSILIFTFTITLTVGIKEGIMLGVLFSLIFFLYRTTKPHIAELGNIPGTKLYRNISRFPDVIVNQRILIIRFDAQLYFANAGYFQSSAEHIMEDKKGAVKLIVLKADGISYIDSSATEMLKNWIKETKDNGVDIYIAEAIGPVRDIVKQSGLDELIPHEKMFNSTFDAVAFYNAKMNGQ